MRKVWKSSRSWHMLSLQGHIFNLHCPTSVPLDWKYVQFSDDDSPQLAFNLADSGSTVTRAWTIKVWRWNLHFLCLKNSKWNAMETFSDHPIWLQLWQSRSRRFHSIFLWSDQWYCQDLQLWWRGTSCQSKSKHLYTVAFKNTFIS